MWVRSRTGGILVGRYLGLANWERRDWVALAKKYREPRTELKEPRTKRTETEKIQFLFSSRFR
jgi:hypothetical protein